MCPYGPLLEARRRVQGILLRALCLFMSADAGIAEFHDSNMKRELQRPEKPQCPSSSYPCASQ